MVCVLRNPFRVDFVGCVFFTQGGDLLTLGSAYVALSGLWNFSFFSHPPHFIRWLPPILFTIFYLRFTIDGGVAYVFISCIRPVMQALFLKVFTFAWCSFVWVVNSVIALFMSAVPVGPIIFGAM